MDEGTRKIIDFQLNRKAENVREIAYYCPFEKPAVLLTEPFDKENGIQPTLYWLSCPYLVKAVSRLEDCGLIQEYTKILQEDNEFKEKIESAHSQYAEKRKSLVKEDELKDIKTISEDLLEVIEDSGIGGIRDKNGIKCLHAHLAHYLVDGKNPVGRNLMRMLRWPEKCSKCMLEED